MPTLARLGVELDPTPAQQGGGAIKQTLRDIGTEAEGAQGKAAALAQTLSDGAKSAQRDLSNAAQSVENLQRLYAQVARMSAGGGGVPPAGGANVPPPANINANVSALRQLQEAQAGVSSGFGAMAANADTNANSLMRLVRAMAPFGTEATEMAEKMERIGLLFDVMGERANRAKNAQEVLTAAYRAGAIALPNMEAAEQRVNAARQIAEQAEQRYLAVLRVSQSTTSRAAEMSELLTKRRQEMTVANRQLEESERIINAANEATARGWGATIAVVAGLAAGLAALTIVLEGVHKAWELVTEALKEGAATERAQNRFIALIGNAKAANEAFEELRATALSSGDLFNTEQLTRTAGSLYQLGAGFHQAIELTKSFAEVAAGSGRPIEEVASAYERMTQMMLSGNRTSIESVRSLGQGIPVIQMLSDTLHRSDREIRDMLSTGQIKVEQLQRAFLQAGEAGGRFGGAMERMGSDSIGIIAQIQNRWKEVLSAFGQPIDVALEPILARIIPAETTAEGKARDLGEAVGNFIRELNELAQRDPWGTLKLGFTIAAKEMANTLYDLLSQALNKVAENFGAAMLKALSGYYVVAGLVKGGMSLADAATRTNAFGYGGGQAGGAPAGGRSSPFFATDADWTEFNRRVREAHAAAFIDATVKTNFADAVAGAFSSTTVGQSINAALGRWGIPTEQPSVPYRSQPSGPLRLPDDRPVREKSDQFQLAAEGSDLRKVQNAWREIDAAISGANTNLEKQRALDEGIAGALKNLRDPLGQLDAIIQRMAASGASQEEILLTKWRAYYTERQRLEARTDELAKAGMLSFTNSVASGLNKLIDQWGTWQQMVQTATVDIGNALSSNLVTGLSDIFNQTKNVSQGFKDMAVSILQDIERVILKLEIQIVMEKILAAIRATSSSSSSTGLVSAGISAVAGAVGGGHAGGGRISGGGGGVDDIPAWLTSGEYVIRRDSARQIGYDKLDAINQGRLRFAGGGRAHRSLRFPNIEGEFPLPKPEDPNLIPVEPDILPQPAFTPTPAPHFRPQRPSIEVTGASPGTPRGGGSANYPSHNIQNFGGFFSIGFPVGGFINAPGARYGNQAGFVNVAGSVYQSGGPNLNVAPNEGGIFPAGAPYYNPSAPPLVDSTGAQVQIGANRDGTPINSQGRPIIGQQIGSLPSMTLRGPNVGYTPYGSRNFTTSGAYTGLYGTGNVFGSGVPYLTDASGNALPGSGASILSSFGAEPNSAYMGMARTVEQGGQYFDTPEASLANDTIRRIRGKGGGYFYGGMVTPAEFASWPRYHDGLLPGERPAVIKDDESVVPASLLRGMEGGGGSVQQSNSFSFELHMHQDGRTEAREDARQSSDTNATAGRALIQRMRAVVEEETRNNGIIDRWGRAQRVK